MHYDSNAGFHSSRKTLASIAKNTEAEEKGGVNQPFFRTRFVRDNYHNTAFFKKVCKEIGNLPNKEINEMLQILKKDTEHSTGDVYFYDEDKMYEVLLQNPICKKVCEKQAYCSWQDIIQRFG